MPRKITSSQTLANLPFRLARCTLFLAVVTLSRAVFGAILEEKVEQLSVVTAVAPEYPELAKRARVRGNVSVEVQIDSHGGVIAVGDTVGHTLLKDVARAAAARWQFNPTASAEMRSARLTFDFHFIKVDRGEYGGRLESRFVPPYHMEVAWAFPAIIVLNLPLSEIPTRSCPVHGDILKLDTVEILYGLLLTDKKYAKAEKNLFPEAHTYYGGGCLLEVPTKAEVLYCPTCRQARATWLAKHGKRSTDTNDRTPESKHLRLSS